MLMWLFVLLTCIAAMRVEPAAQVCQSAGQLGYASNKIKRSSPLLALPCNHTPPTQTTAVTTLWRCVRCWSTAGPNTLSCWGRPPRRQCR